MIDIVIFDVELGQCIFFYPRNDHPEYGLMVDCGNTPKFEPIDKILEWNWLPETTNTEPKKRILKNLTLTNYDQDHFSGLPYLREKVMIETTRLPKNLSPEEILALKDKVTKPIEEMVQLINEQTGSITLDTPYAKDTYYLEKTDFPEEEIDTNKLSQIVFVTYKESCICIPGDLTTDAWDKLLNKTGVKEKLRQSQIFVASHHGREDGFNENVFKYCHPEVIILSDKDIIHKTQEGQTQTYAGQVSGDGICLNDDKGKLRKVLTTRSDGHIWIRIEDNGSRTYKSFKS
jgi:hypothetical protein